MEATVSKLANLKCSSKKGTVVKNFSESLLKEWKEVIKVGDAKEMESKMRQKMGQQNNLYSKLTEPFKDWLGDKFPS